MSLQVGGYTSEELAMAVNWKLWRRYEANDEYAKLHNRLRTNSMSGLLETSKTKY